MGVSELRKDLEDIRTSAQAGDLNQIIQTVDRALQTLDGSRLLTTTEAAELLDIRSVNTLKLLVRQSGIPYERHGNRMMISVAALEELKQTALFRGIQASDRAHDATAELGLDDGMTEEQMRDLSAARPGRLPWQAEEA